METKRICPSCQKPLAADGPLGLCPECLIQSGFPTGVETEAKSGAAKAPRFIPPPVEEMARLFPQLEILELIGQGGMGAVYKARQPKLNRLVALKVLPPGMGNEAAFAERFAREAQALAQLNHPGIVTLYESGQTGGLHFFMMEYVDGVTLQQLLANGRISPHEALAIVPQICDALQFAHDHGIVHRDIKPENILLDRRGRVKVADFGVAKLMGGGNDVVIGQSNTNPGALTDAGKIMGTPNYMSPEQASHPLEVDHRADIYSLGVVFYQMLTGELPAGKFVPPSQKAVIDVRLDEVVLRALEMKPERRYQHVSQVKSEVETIAGAPFDKSSATAKEGESAQPKITNAKKLLGFAVFLGIVLAVYSPWGIFPPAKTATVLKSAPLPSPAQNDGQTLAEQPPVVVETFPVSGAQEVPSGEMEIRVRFSKRMTPDSWSWSTAWEDSAPDFIGQPHYESDATTCLARVKLEPGRTYAFWLNSENFQNFKDSNGLPAVPYLFIFQTK